MPDQTIPASASRSAAKTKSILRDYLSSLGWALALALVIRTFVVQTFEIPSSSMENTLEVGDYLVANKFLYGIRLPWSGSRVLPIREPKRGDVVIFKFPEDRSQDFIKRLVGEPGDEIMVRDKRVYVNGKPFTDPHEVHKDASVIPAGASPRDNFGPVRVPEDSYFMMGDNRDNSYDSRFWGFVPKKDIVGMAVVKYWSFVPGSWKVRWGNLGEIIS
ncbi:signal peptidase I [Fundidesulfovibrio terrae]|uniref:signal peptidase I n=1 Tax=Fundidesulfovibrio terrae TaxID=2922866 RepID=UPI001FAF6073|nr:signal peptidase I [Fundidesulfovibrio terrae]